MRRWVLSMVCAAALAPAAMAADAYVDVVAHDKPVVVEHFDKGTIPSAAPALGQAAPVTEPVSIDIPKPISSGDITVEWWQWWDTNDEKTLMSGVGDDGARLFDVRIRTPESGKEKKKPLPRFAFGEDASAM